MALSFFRALNPASPYSGVGSVNNKGRLTTKGPETIDLTVSENISEIWKSDLNFLSATYNIIIGTHYPFKGQGKKGALDYLIFPLVARKLFMDALQEDQCLFVVCLVALPLELVRHSAAIALTLLLAPIVAVKHIMPDNAGDQRPTACC